VSRASVNRLLGAIWAGLVPTVICLAVYFCIADFVLISQCLYYNHINAGRSHRQPSTVSAQSAEDEPLLARQRSNDTIGLPGSRRRSSVRRPSHASEGRRDSLSKILEEDENASGSSWKRNILSVLLVIIAGTAGWVIAWQSGVWAPTPEDGGSSEPQQVAIGAQVLGYFSAVCYLGLVVRCQKDQHVLNKFRARIPQIVKNYRDKSCEGQC